jgi:hypothetical protein
MNLSYHYILTGFNSFHFKLMDNGDPGRYGLVVQLFVEVVRMTEADSAIIQHQPLMENLVMGYRLSQKTAILIHAL